MITAVLKQHIRKREHKLLPETFPKTEVKRTKRLPGIRKVVLNRYLLIAVLLIFCTLVLLSFKVVPDQNTVQLVLPPDTLYEEAVFNYMISDDVRLNDETAPEDTSGQVINTAAAGLLKITNHQLTKGESISKLAAQYKLNIDTIISFNNIKNVKTLKTGIVLAIPNADGIKYKVKRGDSLSGIAKRFNIKLNTLLDWNNVSSEVIQPNTEYFIPGIRLSKNELNSVLGTLFIYPVVGKLSSYFGWRADPFSGVRSYHNGVDLANDLNTPIAAVMDGTIVKESYNSIFGKYIIIKHSAGYQTLYGHMNKYAVKENQKVSQGQVIGYMGTTGYSTGPHVHLAIFKNGEPVDPLKYLQKK